MITSQPEFEESTAFERWMLSALVPLPKKRSHAAGVKDIATGTVIYTPETVEMCMFAGGVREVVVDLRPLAFGAAWKILDLLIEFALWNEGHRGGRYGRMTIETKASCAEAGAGRCSHLSDDRPLWSTLLAGYAATKETRHSLTHRLAEVDAMTGTLTGRDVKGRALLPLTAEQQEAFCRAVQRAAEAVLTGNLSVRDRSDLAWQLDQLHRHHGRPLLDGIQTVPHPVAIARKPTQAGPFELDVPEVMEEVKGNWPNLDQCDVSIELEDGRFIIAEIENLPHSVMMIDPARLPDAFELWDGPGR